MNFQNLKSHFLKADAGQALVEYALIIVVISLAALAASQTLTEGLKTAFSAIGSRLES